MLSSIKEYIVDWLTTLEGLLVFALVKFASIEIKKVNQIFFFKLFRL